MTASWWLHKRERNQHAGPLKMPVSVTPLAIALLLLVQSSPVVFIYAAKSSSILLLETVVSFVHFLFPSFYFWPSLLLSLVYFVLFLSSFFFPS